MKIIRTIVSAASVGVLFASSALGSAATSEATDAERDLAMGMMGLKQAASDPKLLAQLMADMKDPELMAEAKKMMEDPKFQAEIKKMQDSKEFKDGLKKTKELMEDPSTAAKMQAQMEHMVKVGKQQLKDGAGGAMKEAMEAMNDPEVFAEAMKLMKDPKFVKQLEAFTKDPAFANYKDAMAEMMKDPDQKAKMEQITNLMANGMNAEL
jgi:hypothetical protein